MDLTRTGALLIAGGVTTNYAASFIALLPLLALGKLAAFLLIGFGLAWIYRDADHFTRAHRWSSHASLWVFGAAGASGITAGASLQTSPAVAAAAISIGDSLGVIAIALAMYHVSTGFGQGLAGVAWVTQLLTSAVLYMAMTSQLVGAGILVTLMTIVAAPLALACILVGAGVHTPRAPPTPQPTRPVQTNPTPASVPAFAPDPAQSGETTPAPDDTLRILQEQHTRGEISDKVYQQLRDRLLDARPARRR